MCKVPDASEHQLQSTSGGQRGRWFFPSGPAHPCRVGRGRQEAGQGRDPPGESLRPPAPPPDERHA